MVTPPYSRRSSPFLLQPVQRAVGVLARHAGERADLLLGDLQMRGRFRIEDRIEQRGDAAREARSGIERAVDLEHADELAEPLVELAHQEAVEADAVLEQPHEGGALHQRNAAVAQRDHVVAARLVLEHAAFAEPGARREPRKAGLLAVARNPAHAGKAAHHAGPIIEFVAAHEHGLTGAVGPLRDPGAGDLDLRWRELARPGGDALQLIL